MKLKRIIYIIAILITSESYISAQEVLYDLSSNLTLKRLNKSQLNFINKRSKSAKSLELPFFDDFSSSLIVPDTSKWNDSSVFINNTYAINPPSIGVATFDALNAGGDIHGEATADPFQADQLTSKEINLNYPADSNIYFSFFFQPQGIGNAPEFNDSLILEFNEPGTINWRRVWDTTGTIIHEFKQILIPIDDTAFLKDGFKFRFINYASLSVESSPGMNSNADHWHIDYIKIDKNRNINDTVLRDISFIYPLESFIPQYESMPLDHYLSATFTETPSVYFKYASKDTSRRKAVCQFEFKDLLGNSPSFVDTVRNSDISYNEFIEQQFKTGPIPDQGFFDYQANETEEGLFEIKAYLQTDESYDSAFNSNDTIYYKQKFSNYYAYDDGTPESGYGILLRNAKIAYQFDSKKEDALEAIQIYFNPTKGEVSGEGPYTLGKFFILTVWDDNNGRPGDTLYQELGTQVVYGDSLEGYHEYILDREIIVSGKFYVGLQQTTDEMLNIGFDLNREAKNKHFYNTTGLWNNTQFNGALMMRPVFGEPDPPKAYTNKTKQVTVKPVPANNFIHLGVDGQLIEPGSKVFIYNQYGQLIVNAKEVSYSMDISNLFPGIYIIKVLNTEGNIATGKFIVVH